MYEIEINTTPIKIWAKAVDPHAMKEIVNLSSLPFVFHHLAFMPDVHAGKGMPIGGVLSTKGIIVPNAVGVDIGCGMCAIKTSLRTEDISSEVLRKQILRGIRKLIPLGFEHHKIGQDEAKMPQGFDVDKLTVVSRQYVSATKQVGTLGGGNHFIELQRDDEGMLWIMLHTGSRNLGAQVGAYYDNKAKMLNARWFSSVGEKLNMAFLPMESPEGHAYWDEMNYCVAFALCNRSLMMERICSVIAEVFSDVKFEPMLNIAHNYACWEKHFDSNVIVHRKGATRARLGEIGIIPGSQGTNSYITEGLGNPDSFESCSHGAGRMLSRTEAVRSLNLESEVNFLEQRGIVHAIRSQKDLEEASGAYKDIEQVMANQTDLTKIVTRLAPIAVIKG